MNAETISPLLGTGGVTQQRSDGMWVTVHDLDIRAMARLMGEHEARFVTLTATPDGSGGYRFMYHWDADGELVNFVTTVATGRIATISDILPAADWVEREIRDYYAIEFEGRAETPTLMLRDGDEPGLFSRTCTVGKDVDPATTAHEAATESPEGAS